MKPKSIIRHDNNFSKILVFINKKWVLDILWYLGQNGTRRFTLILNEIPKLNPRILSQRLKDLEQEGLLLKTSFKEIPPRVEYSLTSKGTKLLKRIESIDKNLTKL